MWTSTQVEVKINLKMKREHLVGKFVDVLSRTKTFVRGFVLTLLQVSFEITKIKRNS